MITKLFLNTKQLQENFGLSVSSYLAFDIKANDTMLTTCIKKTPSGKLEKLTAASCCYASNFQTFFSRVIAAAHKWIHEYMVSQTSSL